MASFRPVPAHDPDEADAQNDSSHSHNQPLLSTAHEDDKDDKDDAHITEDIDAFLGAELAAQASSSSAATPAPEQPSSAAPLSPLAAVPDGPAPPYVAAAGGGVRSTAVRTQHDGVFANLAAKPDALASQPAPAELPSYADIAADPHPFLLDTAVTATVADDGEILIDGFPVGDTLAFFVNMFVSLTFDFLGFLLTSLLAVSHAAKLGSQAGFGFTLIRIGVFIRDAVPVGYNPNEDEDSPYAERPSERRKHRDFISFVMIVIGFFVLIRSVAEYTRIRRMKRIIQISSANAIAAEMGVPAYPGL